MKIYYQLVDNNDNSLTSTQADVESKLFATAKEKLNLIWIR